MSKEMPEEFKLRYMNDVEMQTTFEKACQLFDTWNPESEVNVREVFIRAYMLGREKSFLEVGMYDEDETIAEEKQQEFAQKYFGTHAL